MAGFAHNADMTRTRRKSISLFMSLVLMIFSICQVQAWAAAAVPVPMQMAGMDMADCHGGQDQAASKPAMDCHSTCQHLPQSNDVSQKLPLPDVSPVLLAILQPFELSYGEYISTSSYRPPDPSVIDPPPSIRFQRFLN